MHGDDPKELLPCAICVQRFGNWMVLQFIPLIALYCVLQRNRKPSHPSRHVVGAVLHTHTQEKRCICAQFLTHIFCLSLCFVSSGKLII